MYIFTLKRSAIVLRHSIIPRTEYFREERVSEILARYIILVVGNCHAEKKRTCSSVSVEFIDYK